jgi:TonB family protein
VSPARLPESSRVSPQNARVPSQNIARVPSQHIARPSQNIARPSENIARVAVAALALLVSATAQAQAPSGAPLSPSPAANAQLDKPPKLLRFVPATTPAELAENQEVDVILTIDVDAAGSVSSVTVAKSAGAAFDDAAVAAAKQFVFAPGESRGQPVPVRITYRYRFVWKPPPPPPPPPPTATPVTPMVPFDGKVLRMGDRTPLGGVEVAIIVDGGTDGSEALTTTTDAAGKFSFAAVAVGEHVVKLRAPEIVATDKKLTLTAGKKLSTTWYVPGRQRYAATVRAQRAVVETVEQTLSGDELRRIPGTQGDTLKAVQNLPGVARAPFGGGQIVVWGSAPQDTRTYVDGVYIPTLYHFGGLRSTVNSEIVSGLQFLPGGYGADHGRGLGGVIEIETRAPRDKGYHGFAQVDLIDGSLGVEGPITKNLSFEAGLRRSWIDVFLPIFTTNDFQLSPIYYDYQAKLRWKVTPRDELEVFIFGSDDSIKLVSKGAADPMLAAEFASHTYYHRAFVRWFHRFANRATLTVTPSVGYDVPFQFAATIGNTSFSVDAETLEYSLRAAFRQPIWRWLRFDAGIDFEGNRWSVDLTAPVAAVPRGGSGGGGGGGFGGAFTSDALTLDQIGFAPFVELNFTPTKKLLLTPQFRLETFDFRGYQGSANAFDHGYVLPEPRLAARYQIKKWIAVKAAAGVYHQAPDPQTFLRLFGNPADKPEWGWHYVAGVDIDPTPTLHIETEAFYKDLRNLVVNGEYAASPTLTNDGLGRVYGGELLVRQELWHNFFGWVAYTLSRAERKDHPNTDWHLFQYDQTHILTIIGSYKFGRGYQVGIRFRYVTGNPSTPVIGSYYNVNNGSYTRINGPTYSTRLGSFNQLDVRFDKKWTYNKWAMSIYLDIQNIYNASNPEGVAYNFNFTQSKPVSGLPFLPVFGIRADY